LGRKNGSTTSATAFIYNEPVPDTPDQSIPVLITNKHAVEKADRGLLEMVQSSGSKPDHSSMVRVELDGETLQAHVSEKLDLALVPLGPILNQLENDRRPAFFRSVGPELIPDEESIDQLAAMEEIVFIGYPSGLRDHANASPLIRRGITSTPVWNDFQGKPSFLIDAGVFPGSSGSPVFILNQGSYPTPEGLTVGSRILFLGVISETMIRSKDDTDTYLGLGKVVKSTVLKSFLDTSLSGALRQIKSQSPSNT
jgi:hypothetical protein